MTEKDFITVEILKERTSDGDKDWGPGVLIRMQNTENSEDEFMECIEGITDDDGSYLSEPYNLILTQDSTKKLVELLNEALKQLNES